MKAKAPYDVKKWQEETIQQIPPNMKMTKASVEFALRGEIEGTATVEYLMFYKSFDPKDQPKSTASYIGLMRIEGKISGKAGTFALEDQGTFAAGIAKSSLKIIEGSGTGDFKRIQGSAKYEASHTSATLELDYSLT
jgi:ABC-type tungstate transport system permease subunit